MRFNFIETIDENTTTKFKSEQTPCGSEVQVSKLGFSTPPIGVVIYSTEEREILKSIERDQDFANIEHTASAAAAPNIDSEENVS